MLDFNFNKVFEIIFYGALILMLGLPILKMIIKCIFWSITGNEQLGGLISTMVIFCVLMIGGAYMMENMATYSHSTHSAFAEIIAIPDAFAELERALQ